MMTPDEFFKEYPQARELFDRVQRMALELGPLELRVTKSQVAFIHQKAFAWSWVPGKYLEGKTAPLVLTFAFRERDPSPRWKEIVEPYPGRFTHHLEIFNPAEIDGEVRTWLRTAREGAGKVKSKSRG